MKTAIGSLPLYASDLTLAELDLHGGALFWEEVRRFTESPFLAALVADVLKRDAPPRVWIFLDEPCETAGRAAAALVAVGILVGGCAASAGPTASRSASSPGTSRWHSASRTGTCERRWKKTRRPASRSWWNLARVR